MADGTNEFKALETGGYESTETVGALTITTTYDDNFEKTDVSVVKRYENVQEYIDMPENFRKAWEQASDYLPTSWKGSVQFALEGNTILVIAASDDPGPEPLYANGDVLGRINSWEDTNTWTRWFGDDEVDVKGENWNFNFHTADWTYFASSGGNEVYLTNLTDEGGGALPDELDEVGTHISGAIRKSDVSDADWSALQEQYNLSDALLERLDADWDGVSYVDVSDNSWGAVENSYRSADDLWSGGEERMQLHGVRTTDTDPNNVVYLGSATKRDGFIEVRDAEWNLVARVIDPAFPTDDIDYDAMVAEHGDTFVDMWPALDHVLPETLSDPQSLLYVHPKDDGDISVFDASGKMVAKLNHWGHSNTWDRSWDSEFPQQSFMNKAFEVQVFETNETGWGNWISLGRYETGQNHLIDSSGVAYLDHEWSDISSTSYERNSTEAEWLEVKDAYYVDVVADSLDSISSWDDVHRVEAAENSSIFHPVPGWRDDFDTYESTSVRFYSETEMDGGNWYRQKFLGSMEKRDGFIEIRDDQWQIVARVVDLSDTSNLKDWDFITNQYDGIEDAWDNATPFFPKVAVEDGSGTITGWETNPLKDPDSLLFTTDDNTIYAFTAAGVMAGQINFWMNEDEWDRYYDDQLVTVKNVHYNYNFHDAEWNQIANSGGNERHIVDPDGGPDILDEVGKNIGFMQVKDEVDPSLWATYDPNDTTGTIDFTKVSEIRYETRSWESVTNKFRDAEDNWSDSNVQIQYYEDVEGQDWTKFVGSMEKRDGFIEIRDEHWRIVAKKVDGGETFDQMATRYGNEFVDAWVELSQSLPSEWMTADAYKSFKFTTDKWDNILIFDSTGEMVGQINYWSHIDQWDRSWDDEYPSQIHSNQNFHFQGMDVDAVTGNWHWESIGEYQVGENYLVKPDGTTKVLEHSWENVGQTMFARLADPADWDGTIKSAYYTDAVADNLDSIAAWGDIDRIEVSTNTHTFEAVQWRDEVETETSTQVRFYEEVQMEGGWYHTKFLGSMEKRDGFIEIRDQNWNTVARIADLNGSDMLTWVELQDATDGDGNLLYPEIGEAWESVKNFFPDVEETGSTWIDNPLKDPTALAFTTDEEHIYAFTSDGEMVGQINFWSDQNTWDRFYNYTDPTDEHARIEEQKTVKSINYNYNFHDADWNNIANSGGNARYIIDDENADPQVLILDEVGSNIGFMQAKDEVDPTLWETYDPNDDTGTIDFSNVVEIRYETRSWESVSNGNKYRDADQDWSDSNVQIQYFEPVEGQNWNKFVGSMEIRDGFIEIRDEQWDVVSRKVDPALGKTYNQMVLQYGPDFDDAWTALSSSLPSELATPEAFKYTTDQWDNILIFDVSGQMVGQINYWSHVSDNERSWDDRYPREIHENSNFHFQGIETQENGNWHWVSIGQYGVGSNTLVNALGDEVPNNSWVNVGSTVFERMSGAEWDTSVKSDYYIDAVAEFLPLVGGWDDINRIEVSKNTNTDEIVPDWRDQENVNESLQVRFYEEVEMDGGWYHNRYLGSMEKRDGFIEIRDENWNTVSRVVDPDSASDFTAVAAKHKYLDWAWEQVKDYLPDEAYDPNQLSFTEDEYNIYAFDATGAMVVQINSWGWEDDFTDSAGILREEVSFDYNFQDEHWNNFASARKSEEFITDTTKTADPNYDTKYYHVLDRMNTGGSFRVRKDDFEDISEWDAYNPDDKTGTIDWSKVVELSIGVNEWESFENFDRDANGTYTGSEERVEYFELVTNQWGDSWPERVGVIETQGNLQRVYDKHWELVGSQTDGDLTGIKLEAVLNATDEEVINQFYDVLSKYVDLSVAEIIESETGPGVLVEDGQIVASIYSEENYENSGTQLYWNYELRDLNNDNIIEIGGWNALGTAYDDTTLQAKPNGVKVREYFYQDQLSDAEWDALEQEASFTFTGFDWDDVGILTKQVWRNDWSGDGYKERVNYKFIKVDPISGRHDWNYFQTEIEEGAGVTKVMDGDGNFKGNIYPDGVQPQPLADEMGQDYATLLDALDYHLEMHHFKDYTLPMLSQGEFTAIGNSVIWTQDAGYSDLSLVGDLEFDTTPNEWGDYAFRMRFDRDDGNPSFELSGWVSASAGIADYESAEVRIREYVYKTDLDSMTDPKAETAEWSTTLSEYGPSDAFKAQMGDIWDGAAPDVEVIDIESRYRYDNNELGTFQPDSNAPAPDTSMMKYTPDTVRVHFMEGTILSTDELDIEWTWDDDYLIEYSGGVAALMKGDDTQIALELASFGPLPMDFASHVDLFPDSTVGQAVIDKIVALYHDDTSSPHGAVLADAIPGFKSATLQYLDGNVLLVGSGDAILARGDLWTHLTPNEWGHISFGMNFEGPDGNPLIGFGVYSSVDANGKMDLADYGTRVMEYFYKSDTAVDWSLVESDYGPTTDLPVPGWENVELVEVTTRHRDSDGDPLTAPEFDRFDARFVEGNIDLNGRLDLYWDWDTDYRIEFRDSGEQLYQGDALMGTAVSRDLTLSPVTDLENQFISGFGELIVSTGVLDDVIDPASGMSLKVDDATVPNLYVFDDMGELAMQIARASWFNDYEDVEQAYDIRLADGKYGGWLWQSTARDFIDLNGDTHTAVKSEASSIVLSKEDNNLPLEAWKYLNDTFDIPDSFGIEFYELSQVRVRQEKVVDYSDPANPAVVNEHIFLQLDKPGENNVARIGFDITAGKSIAYGKGEWPDPIGETYVDDMAVNVGNAVDVTTAFTAEVKVKIDAIMDALINQVPLGDNFYEPTTLPPDANFDVVVDAADMQNAFDNYEAMNNNGTTTGTIGYSVSTDKAAFIVTVTDFVDTHTFTITSASITDFGEVLNGYANNNLDKSGFMDIVDETDLFVEAALEADGTFGDGVAYTSSYEFNGNVIYQSSVEDADDMVDWMPISYMPDMYNGTTDPNYVPPGETDPNYVPPGETDPNYVPPGETDPNYVPPGETDPNYVSPTGDMAGNEEVFLIGEGVSGEVYIYTPDDQFGMTVTGIGDIAADLKAQDSTLTDQQAFEQALDDFMMEFFADEPMTPADMV